MKRSLLLCGASALVLSLASLIPRRDDTKPPTVKEEVSGPPPKPREQVPSPGRIVHFVLPDGQHRPAIITEALTGRAVGLQPVALTVFGSLLDQWEKDTMIKCPVHFSPMAQTPGTWHWPEFVAPKVQTSSPTEEELARELHEAGREAVEKNLIVRTDVPTKGFIEWDELTENAREGRRVQARYLLKNFTITR